VRKSGVRAKQEQEHEVLRVQILVLLWNEDRTHDLFVVEHENRITMFAGRRR
jgi:hypothetical protein